MPGKPFEKLFDDLDELDTLLDDGPDLSVDGSKEFLDQVKLKIGAINDHAKTLTVDDVELEFAESDEDEDEDESEGAGRSDAFGYNGL